MSKILTWTPPNDPNVIGQRARKRIKGTTIWDATGFNPANSGSGNYMPVSTNSTIATVDDNKIYEFTIESVCTTGGPTVSNTYEGINFACTGDTTAYSNSDNTVSYSILNLNTNYPDITKVRVSLWNGGSQIGTNQELTTSNNIQGEFTSVSYGSGYTIQVEYATTINGTEIWSTLGNTCSTIATVFNCTVPTGLIATNIGSNSTTVSWNSVSGASGYEIRWKKSVDSWSNTWIPITATTYTINSLFANTAYDWQVRTVCDTHNTSSSQQDAFTTISQQQLLYFINADASGSYSIPPSNPKCTYDLSIVGVTVNCDMTDGVSYVTVLIPPGYGYDSYTWTPTNGNSITLFNSTSDISGYSVKMFKQPAGLPLVGNLSITTAVLP